jgi:anaerobic ribonucleoside-triphosphate reductase activating protein
MNGPGCRAVIWLQGCSLDCEKCWNPKTHPPAAGDEVSVSELVAWTNALWRQWAISGLTLSGGEPMEQVAELAELLEMLHRESPALSLGLFSGYSEVELEQGRYRGATALTNEERQHLWNRIRECLDFAVLGRYNRLQPTTAPLVTSRNQRLCLFSDRHSLQDFDPPAVEITIDPQGLTQITGFPVNGALSTAPSSENRKIRSSGFDSLQFIETQNSGGAFSWRLNRLSLLSRRPQVFQRPP